MKTSEEMMNSLLERREAYNARRKQRRSTVKKISWIGGCCCVAVLAGTVVSLHGLGQPEPIPAQEETVTEEGLPQDAAGIYSYAETALDQKGAEDLQAAWEQAKKQEVEILPEEAKDAEASGPQEGNTGEEAAQPGAAPDAPADGPDHLAPSGYYEAPDPYAMPACFGGSYLNEAGVYTVVLTEDTPENRAAVSQALGAAEADLAFETGTYSLVYLTELQDKISAFMTAGELPAVAASAVLEIQNRIEVTMVEEDTSQMEKLLALDTQGGAIQLRLGEGFAVEDVGPAELEEAGE